ncbi:MAG TPA: glycoside hydrolase family 2 TIM barrel-domain containing protein [Chitinophagaceae bacterium]
MKKIFFLFILLVAIVSNEKAQVNFIQNIKARSIYNLDGRWHYIVDPYKTGEGSKFYLNKKQQSKSDLAEYNFEAAPTLTVPGDWNSQDEKLLYYEGTIWYEHDFYVQPEQGKRYFLNFGAANYEARVYLNGTELGKHVGGFTPFQFEVTNVLQNGNNFLVVEVDNTRHKESVPTLNFDWWNYGGITRDVVLAEMPGTFINDYKIQLAKGDLKTITGYIQLDGTHSSQKINIQIPEAGLQITAITNANGKANFSLPVKNLTYWTPENPKLYDVFIGSETDTVKEHIGFRTIETKGKDILLNGKSIFLRGICLHEENPLIPGRPRSKGDLKMLLEWGKELNCNFIRLAHYPHNEYTSQLADEMGLMLWEEVPVYWDIDWTNDSTFNNAKNQLSELIARDKNRASVIIWSIGNETPAIDARENFMERLADHVHALDESRLVSAALLAHNAGNNTVELSDALGRKLDIVSFNEYYGWYIDTPGNIDKYHFKTDYNKPVVVSEFGGGALGGFHADAETRFSEEFQEAIYKNQFRLLTTIDGLRGTCPWILIDFRSPKRLNDVYQQGWNRKGLYTETGKKKKAFFVVKSFYDEMQKKY